MLQRTTTVLVTALFTAGLASGLLTPPALAAQSAERQLVGRVIDNDGLPVVGAEVRVGSLSRTTTDSQGLFQVADMSTGLVSLGVRFPGYYPTADLFRFPRGLGGEPLEVILEPLEVGEEADTAKVQAKADAAWTRDLQRFENAIDAARLGMVVTAEDIRSQQPIWTSDLFLRTPGFRVEGGGGSARVLGSRGRCIPSVFLDDQLARGFQVNDIPPEYIRLLVAYRGIGSVPARYQNPQANANCGTIALYLM